MGGQVKIKKVAKSIKPKSGAGFMVKSHKLCYNKYRSGIWQTMLMSQIR